MGPRGRKVLGDVESSRIVGSPWEGRLGGEQCERREEPRRKGLQPAAWRFVFSQRGIHIKTPAPRVPSVRSSCLFLAAPTPTLAGYVFVSPWSPECSTNLISAQRHHTPRHRQNTSGVDKMRLLLQGPLVSNISSGGNEAFLAQKCLCSGKIRQGLLLPMLVALSRVTGRSPVPRSCQPSCLLL